MRRFVRRLYARAVLLLALLILLVEVAVTHRTLSAEWGKWVTYWHNVTVIENG